MSNTITVNVQELFRSWLNATDGLVDEDVYPTEAEVRIITMGRDHIAVTTDTDERYTLEDKSAIVPTVQYQRMSKTFEQLAEQQPNLKAYSSLAFRFSMERGFRVLGYRSSDQIVPISA